MKASSWARAQQWLHEHPWAGTGFFLGIGLGILICLPLLPYALPDSSAQLIGSFLGAAIAVTGAMWATTVKERKFRADLRLTAIVIYEPFLDSLAECVAPLLPLDGQVDPLEPATLERLAYGKNLSKVTRASFDDLRPAFGSTPNDIIVHRHLLGAMDRFTAFFDAETYRDKSRRVRQQQERQALFNPPNTPRTTPSPVSTQELLAAIDNIKNVMGTVAR